MLPSRAEIGKLQSMGQVAPTACFREESFIGTQPQSFIYKLPMAVFVRELSSWVKELYGLQRLEY